MRFRRRSRFRFCCLSGKPIETKRGKSRSMSIEIARGKRIRQWIQDGFMHSLGGRNPSGFIFLKPTKSRSRILPMNADFGHTEDVTDMSRPALARHNILSALNRQWGLLDERDFVVHAFSPARHMENRAHLRSYHEERLSPAGERPSRSRPRRSSVVYIDFAVYFRFKAIERKQP